MTPTETAAHTPGPWTFNANPGKYVAWIARSVGNYDICVVAPSVPHKPKNYTAQVGYADARLIAAAPELLDALKCLLDEVERERDYEHWQSVIDPARAVIAKAEGR